MKHRFREALMQLAVHIYGLLIKSYPPPFRRVFAEDMVRLFEDGNRDAYRHDGLAGLFR